jgi:hypothetical protein
VDNHGKSAANTCEKALIYYLINVAFIRKEREREVSVTTNFT